MAAGDVVIVRDVKFDRHGLRLIVGTVTLDGGNPTPILLSGYLSGVDMAVVSMDGTAAPGADPTLITSVVSAQTVNVYAWKATTAGAGGNADLIASSNNARLVSFMALGPSKVEVLT
jgi:hypothetical protein